MNLSELADLSNVSAAIPADDSLNSGWFRAAGYTKMHLIVTLDATDENILVTPAQATASDGTGTKALNMQRVWSKEGTATSFTRVDAEEANVTLAPGAAVATYILEFDVDMMDIVNDFEYIQLALTGSGALAGRIQSVFCVPMVGV